MQGFAGGVGNMINAKSVFETVPQKYNGVVGCLTNILILFFGMTCTFLGMTLPSEEPEMMDD
jgi:hypothetical protein